MKLKSCFAACAALLTLTATASAEQPQAQTYRALLQSGNYCVEYKDLSEDCTVSLAYRGGQAARQRTVKVHNNAQSGGGGGWLGAIIALGSAMQTHDEWITNVVKTDTGYYMRYYGKPYGDGNKEVYYRFLPKEKANDPDLAPDEYWTWATGQAFEPPEALNIFNWSKNKRESLTEPVFSGTMEKTADGKTYTCDRYLCTVKTAADTVSGQLAYDVLYDGNGTLKEVQENFLAGGGEKQIARVVVVALRAPQEGDFRFIERGTVYTASTGDIQDLINNTKEIGKVGAK